MNESTISGFNTDNSISSKETINTSTSFERDIPIPKEIKKYIVKSISKNLKDIIKENIQNKQMKYVLHDIFYFNSVPAISLDDYIYRIYKYFKMNISSLIMSVIYIDRFCEMNGYVLCMNNIHKILCACCLLSVKFNEDVKVNMKYYAEIAGLPVNDLNCLEFYLCMKLKFSFFVDYDIYQKYFDYFYKCIILENKEKWKKKSDNKNKNDK